MRQHTKRRDCVAEMFSRNRWNQPAKDEENKNFQQYFIHNTDYWPNWGIITIPLATQIHYTQGWLYASHMQVKISLSKAHDNTVYCEWVAPGPGRQLGQMKLYVIMLTFLVHIQHSPPGFPVSIPRFCSKAGSRPRSSLLISGVGCPRVSPFNLFF